MIDPQKRLAVFISAMYGGGAQRITLNLIRGIAKRGYHIDLILAKVEGPYLAKVPEAVRVIDLKASRVLTSLPALVRYLRRERPEAMLSIMNYVNIVALWAWRLAGVSTRIVVSEHNTLSLSVQHTSTRRGQLIPQLIKLFYPWANGIVAVSKGVADDLVRTTGLHREHIQVIYNPVVTPELQAKAQAPLDHPWFKPGQAPVLLAVGRLHPQKDFPTLIQAFARVRRARPVKLLILGEGEERPKLESLVRQLDLEQDVSLPGFVENPYAYMAQAALFVLSSRWEGLPTVLIEALSCGTPVIATDCPSGPREILANGQYGQLVPVGDVAVLSQVIGMALTNHRPPPSRASWQSFEQETVVNQYISALLES